MCYFIQKFVRFWTKQCCCAIRRMLDLAECRGISGESLRAGLTPLSALQELHLDGNAEVGGPTPPTHTHPSTCTTQLRADAAPW